MEQNIIYNSLQISSCDTGLVSGYSFLSKEIQSFEKCKWSHAMMFFRLTKIITLTDKKGNSRIFQPGLHVVEMVRQGFVLTPFQSYIDDSKENILILKPKFIIDETAYWNFVQPDLFREGYDFFNLFVAQPVKFLTNYRIWAGDVSDNSPKRFICGEKVAFIYNHFNPDIFPNWKRNSPDEIYNSDLFTQYQYSRTL
jgi:hypothetical protein